ncbi:MAG: hypothetical protein M3P18_17880 [Actinomycetota bacterium]|nr:hypothetical protein [Actinomycetota bacterium]
MIVSRKQPTVLLPGLLLAASVGFIAVGLGVHPPSPQVLYFDEKGSAPAYNSDYLQCLSIVGYWTNADVNPSAQGTSPGEPDSAEQSIITQAAAVASPLVAGGSYMTPTYASEVTQVIQSGCQQSYGGLTAGTPTSPSVSPTASQSPGVTSTFDFASAVWAQAPDDDVQLMRACGNDSAARCRALILRLGGSEEAADFFEERGLFLVGTYPAGPVDIGFVSGPLGANYVASPLILGSTHEVVAPDDEIADLSPKDRTYRKLLDAYPNLMLLPSEVLVEPPVVLDDGGSEVTYQYPLYEGCHACDWIGAARFTFEFAPDGSFLRASPAETCGGWDAILNLGAPYCPTSIDTSTPIETLASNPKQAVALLLAAWEGGNPLDASRVASSGAIEVLWSLPATSPDIAAGECSESHVWGGREYSCFLALGDSNCCLSALVAKAETGYFVAALVGD